MLAWIMLALSQHTQCSCLGPYSRLNLILLIRFWSEQFFLFSPRHQNSERKSCFVFHRFWVIIVFLRAKLIQMLWKQQNQYWHFHTSLQMNVRKPRPVLPAIIYLDATLSRSQVDYSVTQDNTACFSMITSWFLWFSQEIDRLISWDCDIYHEKTSFYFLEVTRWLQWAWIWVVPVLTPNHTIVAAMILEEDR